MKKYRDFRENLKERGDYDPKCVAEASTDTSGGGGAGGSIRGVYNTHNGTDLNGIADGSRNPHYLRDPEVIRTLVKGINLELGGPHSHTVVPVQKMIQKLGLSGLSLERNPTANLEPGQHRFTLVQNNKFETGVDNGSVFAESEDMGPMELVLDVMELENGLGIKADIVTS